MPRNRRMGRSIQQWSGGEVSLRKPNIELEKLVSARVNKGMITAIDSADIPIEALQYAKNAKVIFDKTSRRDGCSAFGPTKPNSNVVLKMASIKHPDGTGHTYRFTPTTIHDLQSGVWNPITETVPLIGTNSDRIQIANLFDIIAFTNNGMNDLQWIDSTSDASDDLIENLSSDLPNAEFRYCTGFFNRVVLAALREENEVLLAWTGEYGSKGTAKHGFEDLDPLVNETSGFSPLIDSPGDLSDFIKGIFGISSILIILRERSIWLGTKQASATNPFNANPVIPGIGCDSPYSAKITSIGLCWFDRRTRTVYQYVPGSTPEPIGRPIERNIINNISDPDLIFAIYDPREDVYSVCIPSVGSNIVQVWSCYFRADMAWTYNEYENLSSFDEVELLTGSTSIDDLLGTIDNLIGDIDDLSPVSQAEPQRVFGFTNGDLAIPDPNSEVDINNTTFQTILGSKAFVMPSSDIYVCNVVIEYEMQILGTLQLWYAADGGVDPINSFILADFFTPSVVGKPQIINLRKVVHSRRFAWQIRATSGKFDILGYEVWVTGAGDIASNRQVR